MILPVICAPAFRLLQSPAKRGGTKPSKSAALSRKFFLDCEIIPRDREKSRNFIFGEIKIQFNENLFSIVRNVWEMPHEVARHLRKALLKPHNDWRLKIQTTLAEELMKTAVENP